MRIPREQKLSIRHLFNLYTLAKTSQGVVWFRFAVVVAIFKWRKLGFVGATPHREATQPNITKASGRVAPPT